MGHADAQANAGVAFLLPLLDLLNDVGPDLDVRIGVENAGEEFEGAVLAGVRQFKEAAILKGGQYAAHRSVSQSAPKRRANHIFTLCVRTL